MQALLFFAMVFSLLVAVFAVQNALPVTVNFLVWHFETSLVIVILGAAVFGGLIFLLLGMVTQIKLYWRLREAQGKVRELECKLAAHANGNGSGFPAGGGTAGCGMPAKEQDKPEHQSP